MAYSWYLTLPFSAKQQRELTKFWVVGRAWTTTANILIIMKNIRAETDTINVEWYVLKVYYILAGKNIVHLDRLARLD